MRANCLRIERQLHLRGCVSALRQAATTAATSTRAARVHEAEDTHNATRRMAAAVPRDAINKSTPPSEPDTYALQRAPPHARQRMTLPVSERRFLYD